VDTMSVLPVFRDPRQAAKLVRLISPTITRHVVRPWKMLGPMVSILRSRSSRYALNELADHHVPVVALHGRYDLPVPIRTATEAVQRTHGTMVTIERAGHSWILRDPETLPAIMAELMDGEVGDRCRARLRAAGVKKKRPSIKEIERACYDRDARVFTLTPLSDATEGEGGHHTPHYRWTVENR
jgi:hypothetical protein